MKSKISIIAAIGKNRELGKGNKLLWNIPEDLKRFKEITNGHPIIMGRKTFESIGRVLPNRTNIVISRDPDLKIDGVLVVNSLDQAMQKAQGKPGDDEVFIIGGGQIFGEAIDRADKIYLTIVDQDFPGADTFFPEYKEFSVVESKKNSAYDGLSYQFLDLSKAN